MTNQFSNISCYEEFEIQSVLSGISKIDILKEIGHKVNDYYFFISEDGIINWYNLEGNYVKDPGILKRLKKEYFLETITKCVIPNSVTHIDYAAFYNCKLLKDITIPNSVISISNIAFYNCTSLTSITIPNSVTIIGEYTFIFCSSLKEIIFKGKTLKEVKQMKNYPFGIEDENIIKCEL